MFFSSVSSENNVYIGLEVCNCFLDIKGNVKKLSPKPDLTCLVQVGEILWESLRTEATVLSGIDFELFTMQHVLR